MPFKRIFIAVLLLFFLAVQAVPLMATDKSEPGTKPNEAIPNYGDGDGSGGGEEHPWQDDDGDDLDVTGGFTKTLDYLIGLFFNKHKEVKKDRQEIESRRDQKNQKTNARVIPRKKAR